MASYICKGCERSCPTANALRMHQERNHINGQWLCGIKKEKRSNKTKLKEAKLKVAELDPITVMEKVNDSSKTNELLEKIIEQNNDLKDKVAEISQENLKHKADMEKIMNQNEEMKEMVTEFARNPKLLVLVDKLYPIQSLKEIDLKMPAFKPVLEILDNELPEYANLAQEKTGKIHCKAVRKLNEIQPTTVKDEEKLFCKDGDVIIKADYIDTTKEFIDVIANSGFEYAQKASVDLKSKRESDQPFKRTILQNASCDTIHNIQEIVI